MIETFFIGDTHFGHKNICAYQPDEMTNDTEHIQYTYSIEYIAA